MKKNLMAMATALTLLTGSVGAMGGERGRGFYESRIERISKIEILLKTVTEIAGGEEPKEYKQKGNGFIIGHYLFSRDHITSKYSLGNMRTFFGIVNVPLDRKSVLSETTSLDGKILSVVIEDKKSDVAIFDLRKTPKLCDKYCNDLNLDIFMKENELYRGQRVYWMGSPNMRNGFYKESHITRLRDKKDKNTKVEHTFMLQAKIIAGTSGKPIWSRNKIVGVAHYSWNGMAGIGFMDNYLKFIKNYEQNGIQKRT